MDTLTAYVDQRVRVTSVSAESTLTRDTVPINVDAIVFWLVWNAEKSHSGGRRFRERHPAERADGAAGIHRAARIVADDRGARDAGPGAPAQCWTRRPIPGASRCSRSRFATCGFRSRWKTRCRARRRPTGSGGRASFWARPRRRSPTNSPQAALVYRDNPVALHLRAMNMLYEAIKEKGSMVIVPSSAVETMGLGGMLATTSLAKNR